MKVLTKSLCSYLLNTRHSSKRDFLFILDQLVKKTKLNEHLSDKKLVNVWVNDFFELDEKRKFKNVTHSIIMISPKVKTKFEKHYKLDLQLIDDFIRYITHKLEFKPVLFNQQIVEQRVTTLGRSNEVLEFKKTDFKQKLEHLDNWIKTESKSAGQRKENIDINIIMEELGTDDIDIIMEEVRRREKEI